MGYTTPNTVSGSDTLTAALWNSQIRDNLEWLRKSISACAVRTTNQTVVDGDAISYSNSLWDYSPVMWSASQPTQMTVKVAGLYQINFSFTASGTTTFQSVDAWLKINGTTNGLRVGSVLGSPASVAYGQLSTVVKLNANDYLTSHVAFSGGGTVAVQGYATDQYAYQPRFIVTYVGAVS